MPRPRAPLSARFPSLLMLPLLLGLLLSLLTGRPQAPNAHATQSLQGAPRSSDRRAALKTDAPRVSEQYGRLPLSFEANRGQSDESVKYLARGAGYSLFLTSTETVLALSAPDASPAASSSAAVLRMRLVGANPSAEVHGLDEQAGKSNYFIGSDPARWRTNVSHYARVRYSEVYSGVDLIYYGDQRRLEYDLIVAPGASPSVIGLTFEGMHALRLDEDGSLRLSTGRGEVRQERPVIYQEVEGHRQEIAGRYVMKSEREVGFEVEAYDPARPLVIDPVLSYATYLGGSRNDIGFGIAVDTYGNAYVTGFTMSENFPTANSMPAGNDFNEAFVSKLNAAGSALVYSTYLGGSGYDEGRSIVVDSSGDAYVTGITRSGNFPTVAPLQAAHGLDNGDSDAFVAKLNPSGTALVYSTYLGGSNAEYAYGIALDSAGAAYVAGQTASTDFPTANALQSVFGGYHFGGDAYVSKLNPAGSALVYSTYLGGNSYDAAYAIAVDSGGNAYLTGATHSTNFPTANAFQPQIVGGGCVAGNGAIAQCFDAFVTKLNAQGSALLYSTYLGGDGADGGTAIAVDSTGSAYVAGDSNAANFPTVNAYQPHLTDSGSFIAASDAFVTKFSPAGSTLIYSTYLGGAGSGETARGIAVDASGNTYISGTTLSASFPLVDSLKMPDGSQDAYVTKLNAAGSALLYSTLLGGPNHETGYGLAIDSAGNAYVTGATPGAFPTLHAFQPNFGGGNFSANGGDAFIAKIGNNALPQPVGLSISAITPDRGGNAGTVTVTIHGSGFSNNASIKLVSAGQPDISPAAFSISADHTVARATFNLKDQATGARSVVVTNPDGSSVTSATPFTIEAGGAAQMWTDILGPQSYRPGQPRTYYIAYGNRGHVDARLVYLSISMSKSATYELGFKLAEPPQPVPGKTFDYSRVPLHYETATEKVIPLFIGFVPAGDSGFLKIIIKGGPDNANLMARVGRSIRIPVFVPALTHDDSHEGARTLVVGTQPPPVCPYGGGDCLATIASSVFECATGFLPEEGCVQASEHFNETVTCGIIETGAAAVIEGQDAAASSAVSSSAQVLAGGALATAACAGLDVGEGEVIVGAMNCGFAENDVENACPNFGPFTWVSKQLLALFGVDPNAKFGSLGVGSGHYLPVEEPLRYSIAFENKPEANAPAQTVVVTDQLDAAKLDFETFSLGPISIGKDKLVTPPTGLSEFKTDVDLRPARNLITRVEAKLDKATGVLTWRFTSLDPATGLPTDDPAAGFLPPNKTAPEGEAQVLFTVQAKKDMATGTEIRNRARIVFDTNEPIDTPEWLNTIDNSRPESHVLSLPILQSSLVFNLKWAGTDTGSGIEHYDIYVSEDGGPFNLWLGNTSSTEALFVGQSGKNYSFRSQAVDRTGHQESAKTGLEATTNTPIFANSIDDSRFFVRQQYLDFLNREPDAGGLNYWTNEINKCGTDARCIHDRRVSVADAFFFEAEFQQTGGYIYRVYRATLGHRPSFAEFMSDRGLVVAGPGLDQSKTGYAQAFVQRSAFLSLYPRSLSADQFVDGLLNSIKLNSGVDLSSQRASLRALYDGTDAGRASIVRQLADSSAFIDAEYNRSFVLMEYFGYLRRDPDQGGFLFWLGQVNKFPLRDISIQHAMACSFITSAEYQLRFSSNVTHSNRECPQ